MNEAMFRILSLIFISLITIALVNTQYTLGTSDRDNSIEEKDLEVNLNRYTTSIPIFRETINYIGPLILKTMTTPLGTTVTRYLFISAGDFSSEGNDRVYINDLTRSEYYFSYDYWRASYYIQMGGYCYVFTYGSGIWKISLTAMSRTFIESKNIVSRPIATGNGIYYLALHSQSIVLYRFRHFIDKSYEVSNYTITDLDTWYSDSWYLLDLYNNSFYGAFSYGIEDQYYITLFNYHDSIWATYQLGPYEEDVVSTLFHYLGSDRHMDIGYGYIVLWDSYNLIVYNASDNRAYNTTTPGFDSSDYNVRIIKYNGNVYAVLFGRDTITNKYVVEFINLGTLTIEKSYEFSYSVSRIRTDVLYLENTALIVIPFENYLVLLDMENGYNVYPGVSSAIEVFASVKQSEICIFIAYQKPDDSTHTYIEVYTNVKPDYRASDIGSFSDSMFLDIDSAVVGNNRYIILSSYSRGIDVIDVDTGVYLENWIGAGYYPCTKVYDDKAILVSLYTHSYLVLDLVSFTWSEWRYIGEYIYSEAYVRDNYAYVVTYNAYSNTVGFTMIDLTTYTYTDYVYSPPPGYSVVEIRGYVAPIIAYNDMLYTVVPVKDSNNNYYLLRIVFDTTTNNMWMNIVYGPDNNIPIILTHTPLQDRYTYNNRYLAFLSNSEIVLINVIDEDVVETDLPSGLGDITNYDMDFSWDNDKVYVMYVDSSGTIRLVVIYTNGTVGKDLMLNGVSIDVLSMAIVPNTDIVLIASVFNTLYIVDVENETIAYGVAYPLYRPVELTATTGYYMSIPWILNYTDSYLLGFTLVDLFSSSKEYQVLWYTRTNIITPVSIEVYAPPKVHVNEVFNVSVKLHSPINKTYYYVLEEYYNGTWRTIYSGYIEPGVIRSHSIVLTDVGPHMYRAYTVYKGTKVYSRPVCVEAYESLTINITYPSRWAPVIPGAIVVRVYDNMTGAPLRDIALSLYLVSDDTESWIASTSTDMYGEALFIIRFYQLGNYTLKVKPISPYYVIVYGNNEFNVSIVATGSNVSYVYLMPMVKLDIYTPIAVELGEIVNAYVVFIWNGEFTDPDIIQVSLDTPYNLTRVSRGIYAISFKPLEPGLYTINVLAEYSGMEFYTSGYTMVYNITSEVNKTLTNIVSMMLNTQARLLGIINDTAVWVIGNTTVTLDYVKELIENSSNIIVNIVNDTTSAIISNTSITLDELLQLINDTYYVLTLLNETYNLTDITGRLDMIKDDIAVIKTRMGYVIGNLTELNMNITAIRDQLIVINSSIGILYTRLNMINATLIGITGDLAIINTSLGIVLTKLDAIDTEVRFINESFIEVKTQLDSIQINITSIVNTLPIMIDKIQVINDTVNVIVSKVDNLELLIQNTSCRVDDIYGEIVILRTNTNYIISNISILKPVIMDINNNTVLVKTILSEINASIEDLLGWAELINESVAVLHTSLGDLTIKIDTINGTINAIYGNIQWVKGVLREIANNTAIIDIIGDTVETISIQLSELKANITDIDGRIALIETNIGYIITSIDNLSYNISAVNNDLIELNTAFGALTVNVTKLFNDINYLKDRGIWITGILNEINRTEKSILISIKTLNGSITETIDNLNDSIAYLGKDIAILKTNTGFILANASMIINLLGDIKEDADRIDETIDKLDQIINNINELSSSIRQLSTKIDNIEVNQANSSIMLTLVLGSSIPTLIAVIYLVIRKRKI